MTPNLLQFELGEGNPEWKKVESCFLAIASLAVNNPETRCKNRCVRSSAYEIAHQDSLDRASLVFAATVVCVLLSLGLACAKRSLHDLG